MTWIKQPTQTWVGGEAFADWYFETWLVSKGWTIGWRENSLNVTGDTYWAISKSWTTASGATQTMNLVYELEFGTASDMNLRTWDGTSDYETWYATNAELIISDSTFFVLSSGENVTIWADDSSPAWIAMMGGQLIGMELDPAGWLVDERNSGDQHPGSRPYIGVLPLFDKGGSLMAIKGVDCNNRVGNAITGRANSDTSIYQDYTALFIYSASSSVQAREICWEDPSGEIKMKAYELENTYDTYEVAQIGSEYFITCGPMLLPVGSTEPTL